MNEQNGQAMTPKLANGDIDPPNTLAVVGVAFASLIDHGMAQDIRVERLVHEVTMLHRTVRRTDERFERSRKAHHEALKTLDGHEVKAEAREAELRAQIEALKAQVDHTEREARFREALRQRDEIIAQASLTMEALPARMRSQMGMALFKQNERRFRKAWDTLMQNESLPAPLPSQEYRLIGPPHAHRDAPCGPECYEPVPVPATRVYVDPHSYEATVAQQGREDKANDVEYVSIVADAKAAGQAVAPDEETARRLRKERKEAAGRAQLDEVVEEPEDEEAEDDF